MRIEQRGQQGQNLYFDVDMARMPYVVSATQPERVVNRETGEAIVSYDNVPLWRADVYVPGCKIQGGVGMAEVRLTIESDIEPRFEMLEPVTLTGKVGLRGWQEGRGNDRRSGLALRSRGVMGYNGATLDSAMVDVAVEGIPVELRSDGPLVVLAASKAKNVFDGRPITVGDEQVVRLQVSANQQYERADGTAFTKRESVMVDVVESVWRRSPVPFMGRIELVDLRCDARTTNNGGLTMALAAAGYNVLSASAPVEPEQARNGRRSRFTPEPAPEVTPDPESAPAES